MRNGDSFSSLVDWLTNPPSGGRPQQWVVGVGLALLTLAYGISCLVAQRVSLPRVRLRPFSGMPGGFFTEITGSGAIVWGVALIWLAFFVHFQWFWGNHPRLSGYYEIGKYPSLLGFIVSLIVLWFVS